ncbi:hypothetical protein HS1genome_1485 [Sulfodiicoccus acidiphilus]|uniref:MFS transporter n=2 Tax=Sulfodiicoccus acidiphilus TaxID=1670455 RepID=A0A348B4J4_9CREN|nr:hypothetical protein HS1genome_1485 [Sulfodiicoccus acidiphilus]GGU00804.1 hypothetical protein GCM10007116_17610 [Sulfodiicoccus acidiphilus]
MFYLNASRVCRSAAAGIIMIVYPYLMLKGLHVSVVFLGLIYTAAALATALLGVALGYATDLWGRKESLILGSILLPISSALLLFGINVPLTVAAALLGGISSTGSMAGGGVGGAVAPVQSSIIADLTKREERTVYISLLSFIGNLAASAGFVIGGFMTVEEALYGATVLGILSVLLVLPMDLPKIRASSFKLKHGGVVGKFSITGLLNGLSQGLVTPFLIPFFIVAYDLSRSQMGIYGTIGSLLATFTLLVAPRLERWLGFLGTVYVTRGATVLMMGVFPFVRVLWGSLLIYVLYPSLRVVSIPVTQSAMMGMVDADERGRINGLNQSSRLGFSALGTAVATPFFDGSLLYLPFLAYSVTMAFNVYLYRKFFRVGAGVKSREAHVQE